ncbi:MAG: glycosyltransferase family 2 protein [Anaerolineales bacterium]|nr:glycosyltransferase family 2 protein [Anaerolineales bacterium]MDW8276984.1 glycosyltransferase family 2 protein [Anaerolineales bacterium]
MEIDGKKLETDALLTIVIPVYNEEKSLERLVPVILEVCEQNNWQAIFVNDGSSDNSAKILEMLTQFSSKATVFHHKINRGYGAALKSGIRRTKTPYLITMDADGQHRVEDIRELLDVALSTNADLVIGRRDKYSSESVYRTIGKKLIYLFTSILMPLPVKDINSGFKLYRTRLAKIFLQLCPDSMAFSDVMTLVFVYRRHLVLEHPIQVLPRSSGRSTITTRTAFETIIEIFNIILLFNPLRIFLPLSFSMILVGIFWSAGVYIIVRRGMSVGGMLAIVTGLVFLAIGLLSNLISDWRMRELEEQIES